MIPPQLITQHEMLRARYGKLAEARKTLDAVREQLGGLEKLGDLISPEDVIKAGGHLVAAGLSPMALAKLMGDMPDSGPALSGWLQRHVADVAQREAQLGPVLAQVQHQMGTVALQMLLAHHFTKGMPGPAPGGPAGAGNALIPPPTVVEEGSGGPSAPGAAAEGKL